MGHISNFLVFLRKRKGVTQKCFAKFLGVSNKTISKWETGNAIPDTFYLMSIAQYYNITVDELLNGCLDKLNNNEKKNKKRLFGVFTLIFIFAISHLLTFYFQQYFPNQFWIWIICWLSLFLIISIIFIFYMKKTKKRFNSVFTLFLIFINQEFVTYLLMLFSLIL